LYGKILGVLVASSTRASAQPSKKRKGGSSRSISKPATLSNAKPTAKPAAKPTAKPTANPTTKPTTNPTKPATKRSIKHRESRREACPKAYKKADPSSSTQRQVQFEDR